MDLFATGFNAWNQLSFAQGNNLPEEPDDLYGFTKVLSATTIERPVSRLTYTIGTSNPKSYPITSISIDHISLICNETVPKLTKDPPKSEKTATSSSPATAPRSTTSSTSTRQPKPQPANT